MALAARGLESKEICGQLGIKTQTLTRYKKQKLFRNAFYTMSHVPTVITTAMVKKVAQADALNTYLNIRKLQVIGEDATAAEKRVALSANETGLKMAGVYEEESKPFINIGQLLVQLSREELERGDDPMPQWKR